MKGSAARLCIALSFHGLLAAAVFLRSPQKKQFAGLEYIRVADDGRHFVGCVSGRRFSPLGFNYDHDRDHRLLESRWDVEWGSVERNFQEMKQLEARPLRNANSTARTSPAA